MNWHSPIPIPIPPLKGLAVVALCWGLALAQAATLKVIAADRLEIRNENGEELVILTGNPVLMERDEEKIEALRVVYNRARKRLQLMGKVRYQDKEKRVLEAEELELDTSDNSLEAIEVKVRSGDFDLTGPYCQRVAGQILLQQGFVTSCLRCGQAVPDYGFRAKEVLLLPGDRLIAREVWVVVRGQPVLYLPVIGLFLSERRPRVDLGTDVEGFFFNADLPYVNEFGIGYTLLRYTEARGWGFGFDHYGLGAAYSRYQFLYLPPAPGDPLKRPLFQWSLEYRLQQEEYKYEYKIERKDTDPGRYGITSIDVNLSRDAAGDPDFKFRLKTFLDGYAWDTPYNTDQVLPEFSLLFNEGLRLGGFSVRGAVTAGYYVDRLNQDNRSARRLDTNGDGYIGTGRLYVQHAENYTATPWEGASFSFNNFFEGWYYTTRNPPPAGATEGELERLIRWDTSASFTQRLAPFSLSLNFANRSVEGESPLAREARVNTLSRTLGSTVSVQQGWFSSSATLNYNFVDRRFDPFALNLELNPSPVNFGLTYRRDINAGYPSPQNDITHLDLSARFGLNLSPFRFSANGSYIWASGTQVLDRYGDLNLALEYTLPSGTARLTHQRDLNNGQAKFVRFNFSWLEGPDSYLVDENFNFNGVASRTYALDGFVQGKWGPHTLKLEHRILFPDQYVGEAEDKDEGKADLTLSYDYAATLRAILRTTLIRGLGFDNPQLSLGTGLAEPGREARLEVVFGLPDYDQPYFYLSRLSLLGALEILPGPKAPGEFGLSLQGGLRLERINSGPQVGNFSVGLNQFGPTLVYMGQENERLIFGLYYTQAFTWRDSSGNPLILKPLFVLIYDRCCWAMRLTIDTQAQKASLAFLLGGEAADFLFDRTGIRWPWDK